MAQSGKRKNPGKVSERSRRDTAKEGRALWVRILAGTVAFLLVAGAVVSVFFM